MLKVIIVDDEINVVEGLKKTIKWQEHNCVVVGTAYDGQTALDLVRNLKPDILITDITMPLIDGITLVSMLKPLFPAMRFIILTCHDDFEIARNAFRIGACDYIVKETMTHEELYRSIEKASQEIYQYRENVLSKSMMLNEFISKFSPTENNDNKKKLLTEKILPYSLDFESRRYLMCLLFIQTDMLILKDTLFVENELKNILAFYPESYLFRRSDYEYILMINVADNVDSIHTLVKNLYEYIKSVVKKEGYDNLFYVSTDICSRETVACIYQMLYNLREQSFYSRERFFITSQSTQKQVVWDNIDNSTFLEKCEEGIYQLDITDSTEKVHDFINKCIEKKCDPSRVIIDCRQILIILSHRVMKIGCSTESILPYFQQDFFCNIGNIYFLEHLICKLLKEEILLLQKYISKEGNEEFLKAIRFIEENLGDKLTLDKIAKHVAMNASYFSRYFKNKVGENFVDFIVRRRIESAKQKLQYTNLSVETISYQVGYSNTTYFNDSFKKIVGVTPGIFRKQHRG